MGLSDRLFVDPGFVFGGRRALEETFLMMNIFYISTTIASLIALVPFRMPGWSACAPPGPVRNRTQTGTGGLLTIYSGHNRDVDSIIRPESGAYRNMFSFSITLTASLRLMSQALYVSG